MPIQPHLVPWSSLAAEFEYRPAKSGKPGDQRPDIYPRKNAKQAQQVRYFVKVFKGVLEEQTKTLRAKLRCAEHYRHRARKWQYSVRSDEQAEHTASASSGDGTRLANAIERHSIASNQVFEDRRILCQRVALIQSGWDSEQESRLLFSREFLERYQPRRRLGDMAEFQTIESWLKSKPAFSSLNTAAQMTTWGDERTRSDILKLLIIDAARHENKWERTTDLDIVLLLKYHPQVNFNQYVSVCLQCCNIECGIRGLQNSAIQFLLYFGILETMIDHGEARLMSHTSDIRVYMTLVSLRQLVFNLTTEHEYLAETIPFRMSWETRQYPDEKWNLRRTLATDLLSERNRLAAMYKWQCKILILTNLICSDDEHDVKWEQNVIDQLDGVFEANLVGREGWER